MGFGDSPAETFAKAPLVVEHYPKLMVEFSVAMPCGGCAKTVRKALERVEGVKSVDIQLAQQVVRVLAAAPLGRLTAAMAGTGKKHRVVAHGPPAALALLCGVAEFKGPRVFGVVRLSQLSQEWVRIEATFAGLPGSPSPSLAPRPVPWALHAYGDLTRGAAATGPLYSPRPGAHASFATADAKEHEAGDLGELVVDQSGTATYLAAIQHLNVADLIGRAVVVNPAGSSTCEGDERVAAVIALSASTQMECLCACDGTQIWQAGAACQR